MIKEIKKVQIALLAFGVFVVCYNFYEFITQKYSTSQGITFIVESLLGIALIFMPQVILKVFKLKIPAAIVLFYWFFLFISVFSALRLLDFAACFGSSGNSYATSS